MFINYFFKKIKIIENGNVFFCENECEIIIYVFFMCIKVVYIWNDLSLYIFIMLNIYVLVKFYLRLKIKL